MKCHHCKERTLREWIFRLVYEGRRATAAHFITLTYDNAHVPRSKNGFKTLNRQDLTLFMKRLRKNTGIKGIKYFACGEYGTQRKRPHYHAIVYNQPDPKAYQNAWAVYSPEFKRKVAIGETHTGTVNQKSIAYTCKYLDKPNLVGYFKNDDRAKEFRAMSQDLGANYITPATIRFHRNHLDKLYLMMDGFKVPMPKYYQQQIYTDLDRKEQLAIIVDKAQDKQRKMAEYAESQGKTYIQYRDELIAHKKRIHYKNKKPRS